MMAEAGNDVVRSAVPDAEVDPDKSSYRPHTGTLDASPDTTDVQETAALLETTVVHEPTVARPPVPQAAAPRKPPPAVKRRRPIRVIGWVAAAAAVIAAGVGVAGVIGTTSDGPAAPGSTAGPNRVAIVAAERVLGDARASIARRDFDDARALLDRASSLIDGVGDPAEERRLRAEVERLRQQTVETAPMPTSSASVAVRPAPVQATKTAAPVKPTRTAEPPQVTTTTSSTTRRGLPTLLPSVIPSFPRPTRTP